MYGRKTKREKGINKQTNKKVAWKISEQIGKYFVQ